MEKSGFVSGAWLQPCRKRLKMQMASQVAENSGPYQSRAVSYGEAQLPDKMILLPQMVLDVKFKNHLHSLMVEVAEKTSDERERYKRQRRWEAQQTHNAAAMPGAYMDGELHSIEIRVGKTIEKYLETVDIWGFPIDETFERDMINEFIMLTAGPNQLHFPPMMKGSTIPAVQASFSRERAKLANRLVREGTNRLCELKMKKKQVPEAAKNVTNNVFNAQVSNAYINSSIFQTTSESKDEKVVMLKPNIHGIGIDLRTLWRKVRRGLAKETA